MRLSSALSEILASFGWDAKRAGQELGMDERTVKDFLKDETNWRLDRKHLRSLMLLAFEAGHQHGEIFELRPHPLWDTFRSPTTLIRNPSARHDAAVEAALRRFLEHLGCTQVVSEWATDDAERVEWLMKSTNCILVGSPKSNPASEIAVSLLWGAQPFDASPENRARVPARFVGMEVARASCMLDGGNRPGIMTSQGLVAVDWLPEEQYRAFSGEGWDAAAVFYCRQPIGAGEDVSTVVIGGFTGRATVRAARHLTHGEHHGLYDHDVRAKGNPLAAVLRFKYNKRVGRGRGSLEGLRTDHDDLDKDTWIAARLKGSA